jgi:hypothetical protein
MTGLEEGKQHRLTVDDAVDELVRAIMASSPTGSLSVFNNCMYLAKKALLLDAVTSPLRREPDCTT